MPKSRPPFVLLLACLAVVACVLLAGSPTSAQETPSGPTLDLDGWVSRVRDQVRKTVERVQPDWQRWIPRPQPPRSPESPPSSDPPSDPPSETPPPTSGPSWPQMPRLPGLPVPSGHAITADDLGRVLIGYQAGILKIVARDGQTVLFVKDRPGTNLEGIDSREFAPVRDHHRKGIFRALDVSENSLEATAEQLMRDFGSLPKTKAAALLGVLASTPHHRLSEHTASRVRTFLADLLRTETDVKVRRIAVLSLAVAARTDEACVSSVVDFMEASHNSWETWTTQLYFEYHRAFIRSMPTARQVRQRIRASGNPYAPRVVASL